MDHSSNLIGPRFAVAVFLSLIFLATSTGAIAQQPASSPSADRDRGIALYKQDDAKGAIVVLRAVVKQNNRDADAWHYLGLALLRTGNKSEAREAFEKAATLRLDSLRSVKYPGPASTAEERTARRLASLTRLKDALDSVEQYTALTPRPSDEWTTQQETLRFNKEYYEGDPQEEIVSAESLMTKARILSKPEPSYTREALQHGVKGTVVLRALFSYNGTVRYMFVVRGLGYGLTEKAIQAAQQIKFVPATKDGHPVSMWIQLEYNFSF